MQEAQVRKYLLILVVLICYGGTSSAEQSNNKIISPQQTYLLAIGACPPWKEGMTAFCGNAVRDMTETLHNRLRIPKNNIKILLGSDSTYKGVEDGFKWATNNSNKNSRVIIYWNTHGDVQPQGFSSRTPLWDQFINRDRREELFVLWTEKIPLTIETAIQEKQWITAKKIRKMLDKIAAQKIIIIDACYSGAAKNDFIKYGDQVPNINRREAFIFSSLPLEVSQVDPKADLALFTHNLAQEIEKEENLEDAFKKARNNTFFQAVDNAFEGAISKNCLWHHGVDVCGQLPFVIDKHNILPQVHFENYVYSKDKCQ